MEVQSKPCQFSFFCNYLRNSDIQYSLILLHKNVYLYFIFYYTDVVIRDEKCGENGRKLNQGVKEAEGGCLGFGACG